jgi:hypothetical protein
VALATARSRNGVSWVDLLAVCSAFFLEESSGADATVHAAALTRCLLHGQSSPVRHGQRLRPCATVGGCVVPRGLVGSRRQTGGAQAVAAGAAPVSARAWPAVCSRL